MMTQPDSNTWIVSTHEGKKTPSLEQKYPAPTYHYKAEAY